MKLFFKKTYGIFYNFFVILILFIFANSLLFVNAKIKNNDFLLINENLFLNKNENKNSSFDLGSVVVVNNDENNSKDILIEYTIIPGDNLSSIATRFGTTVKNIMKVNNLRTSTLRAGKKIYITPVEGFIITLDRVTNPMVFANIYGLDLKDLMTTNGITDKLQLLAKGDDLFIPVSREKGIEIGLLEEPKPIVPIKKIYKKKTNIVLTKSKLKTKINARYIPSNNNLEERTYSSTKQRKPHIVSKRTYSAPISNGFYKGQCTWYVALNADWAFPYVNNNRQFKSWRGDAKKWFDGAKRAGFVTSSRPTVGAIMVVGGGAYGHVTLVKKVDWVNHRILVQGMNYLRPYVVTKRRIYMDKTMTKVVANSKFVIGFIPKQKTPQRILNEISKLK